MPWDFAGLHREDDAQWSNWAQNQRRALARAYRPWNIHDDGTQNDAEAGARNVRRVVEMATAAGASLRCFGAKWSFSDAAVSPDELAPVWGMDMRALGNVFSPFDPSSLADPSESSRLLHVQAGTEIFRVNQLAQSRGRSLFSVGGSQGQTLGGAALTGTHGGFVDRKPLADYVRAMRIVANGGRQFFIESSTRPVLSQRSRDAMLSKGIVPLLNDVALFGAAVSVGAMGAVISLVLDTDDLFFLEMERTLETYAAVRPEVGAQDFSARGERPFHYEVVVDPYRAKAGEPGCYVTIGRRFSSRASVPAELPAQDKGTNPLIGDALSSALNPHPAAIPWALATLFDAFYPPKKWTGRYTLAEFFPRALPDIYLVDSMELAVPQERALEALDAIVDLVNARAPGAYFAGIIAVRMSLGTDAYMGLSRWPRSCTFEMSSPRGFAETQSTYAAVKQTLRQKGIPFTQHLGQENDLDAQQVIDAWGGDRVTGWKIARAALHDPGAHDCFASAFARRLGLV